MTTRRGFLSLMLAAASAPAIVKSSSLMKIWVPKQELFLFGPVTQEIIVPGNKLLTIDQITREALKMLENNLIFSENINRSNEWMFNDFRSSGRSVKAMNEIINSYAG